MNYEQMSDFEINKRIAICLGLSPIDRGELAYVPVGAVDKVGSSAAYTKWVDTRFVNHDGLREVVHKQFLFNPCRNHSDMWPLIVACDIAVAPNSKGESCAWDPREGLLTAKKVYHTNPLRAAAIVYLMMKEKA